VLSFPQDELRQGDAELVLTTLNEFIKQPREEQDLDVPVYCVFNNRKVGMPVRLWLSCRVVQRYCTWSWHNLDLAQPNGYIQAEFS
jgi:hypothetical protein